MCWILWIVFLDFLKNGQRLGATGLQVSAQKEMFVQTLCRINLGLICFFLAFLLRIQFLSENFAPWLCSTRKCHAPQMPEPLVTSVKSAQLNSHTITPYHPQSIRFWWKIGVALWFLFIEPCVCGDQRQLWGSPFFWVWWACVRPVWLGCFVFTAAKLIVGISSSWNRWSAGPCQELNQDLLFQTVPEHIPHVELLKKNSKDNLAELNPDSTLSKS